MAITHYTKILQHATFYTHFNNFTQYIRLNNSSETILYQIRIYIVYIDYSTYRNLYITTKD